MRPMEHRDPRIEVVRGQLADRTAEELLVFWSDHSALAGVQAQRRLPEVVCVLREEDRILGASSVFASALPLIGGRRFWIYRSLLAPEAREYFPDMVRSTFNALASEFTGSPGSPVGLCVLLEDAQERRRRPEVEWSDPRTIYAGYLADGRQVRIAYFDGAVITLER
jgi:hypothetical protein